jgi:hypothetical protein
MEVCTSEAEPIWAAFLRKFTRRGAARWSAGMPRRIWLQTPSATPRNGTRSEIELAARLAGIHDLIASLPDGLESWIGDQGINLSGGRDRG